MENMLRYRFGVDRVTREDEATIGWSSFCRVHVEDWKNGSALYISRGECLVELYKTHAEC